MHKHIHVIFNEKRFHVKQWGKIGDICEQVRCTRERGFFFIYILEGDCRRRHTPRTTLSSASEDGCVLHPLLQISALSCSNKDLFSLWRYKSRLCFPWFKWLPSLIIPPHKEKIFPRAKQRLTSHSLRQQRGPCASRRNASWSTGEAPSWTVSKEDAERLAKLVGRKEPSWGPFLSIQRPGLPGAGVGGGP